MSLMIHTYIPGSLEIDRIIILSLRSSWATEWDLASRAFLKNYLKNPKLYIKEPKSLKKRKGLILVWLKMQANF